MRHKRKGPPPTENEIRSALNGRTVKETAKLFGYSLAGFQAWLNIYGIDTGKRLKRSDSELIAQLIDGGMSRAEVAEKFERTEQVISMHYHRVRGTYLPTAKQRAWDR